METYAKRLCLLCVILLELIPGAVCQDSSVGGMVAAAVCGGFLFAAVIIMALFAIFWRDWYMRRMARRGRRRIPREKGHFFFHRKKTSKSLLSTPRSERRMNFEMHEPKIFPGSRYTTLSRPGDRHEDAWLTKLSPTNHYEEKSQTLKFEPEEEAVIVAEVLPDQTQTTHFRSTNLRSSNGPGYVITTTESTNVPTTSQNTVTVPYRQPSAFLSKTTNERVSYQPYHVQVSQLSQTTKPGNVTRPVSGRSGKEDIFITPLIPGNSTASSGREEPRPAVAVFDSDDEAGNIPNPRNTEDDVLF